MADLIDMPKLSDTMSVGTLIKWLKKEGDTVQAGDMLAEIETDKATMELETFFTGTLIKIYAEAGSEVAIGAPLCAIGKPGEAAPTPPVASAAPPPPPAAVPAASVVTVPAPVAAPVPVPAPPVATVPSAASPTSTDRLKISPLARKIAADQKIDATHLTGSGPGGRIVKADVLAAAANPLPAVAPKSVTVLRTGPIQAERTVPATNMRATIAKRLLEAKTQIPHFYLEIEVDADPLLTVRAQLNTALATEGVKLSINDFILKASAEALRRVPGVNASWTGSGIHYHGAAHVSFAVAIEDGLITPVIRDAHLKSVFAISTEVKPLGQRAKQKKLKPEEFTGGTFCVSNLGMMGIPKFSAIINPPNAAILAVGTTVTKPVVKNGTIVVGQTMTLTLSCDHRVVDGALGAQFLAALKGLLEKPALLLV